MPQCSDHAPAAPVWAIVLAGGEGVRLRPLVRQLCGHERPKQFANILGSKSLLGHTLDRVGLEIPPARTVIVTCRAHSEYMAREFAGTPPHRVLEQPQDRGTAAGIFFPAHWINSTDPDAVVAIFPSDHFILEGDVFMRHIRKVATFVRTQPERMVLIGAQAGTAETEYGWIEPGDPLGRIGADPILRVTRFWEKPSEIRAKACLEAWCLWNTFVLVAKLSTLILAGRKVLPDLSERMLRAARHSAGGSVCAAEREYGFAAKADFSGTVLQERPELLAVSPLPSVTWSDLGTPRMVMRALQMTAPWALAAERA
jgi:mannose-1-phosphate guanylyltransferase